MGLTNILKKTRGQLEGVAYGALKKLKHSRRMENMIDVWKYEDEMNDALDELNERKLYDV